MGGEGGWVPSFRFSWVSLVYFFGGEGRGGEMQVHALRVAVKNVLSPALKLNDNQKSLTKIKNSGLK